MTPGNPIQAPIVVAGAHPGTVTTIAGRVAHLGPAVEISPAAGRRGVDVDPLDQRRLAVAFEAVERDFGVPAGLVIAPSPIEPRAFVDHDDAAWEADLEANLGVAARLCRVVGPALVGRGEGWIAVVTWRPPAVAESTHLGAVSGAGALFAKALAADLGSAGIRVVAVTVPVDDPGACAPALALLASAAGRYITAEVLEPGRVEAAS